MKTTPPTLLLALGCAAALLAPVPSRAQAANPAPVPQGPAAAPVYESHDKAGPVFSDRPTPGATRLELTAPNVIQTPQAAAPPSAPVAAAPPYRSIAIQSPADGATIHSNTGSFQVTVHAEPSLRAGTGDRFRLKLDGHVLPHDYGSTAIHLNASDWNGDAAENVAHTLQLTVVDAQGRVLIESAPVTFYAHRAAVGHHR